MMQFLFLYLYKHDHRDIFDDLTCIYHRRMMIAVVRDIVCEGDGKENGTNGLEKKNRLEARPGDGRGTHVLPPIAERAELAGIWMRVANVYVFSVWYSAPVVNQGGS